MSEIISLSGNVIIFPEKNRGKNITDILVDRFGDTSYMSQSIDDLHDPYLLKDMDRAVARIKIAKKQNEKVIIFGDYDVDGVTATSLLMHLCKKLEMAVSYRLPHRVHDGYGLKKYFIDELSKLGVDLIITVDCGSRDREIVSYAKQQGIDIIVTDHHHVPPDMPDDAVAFINPNRPDCEYPYKGLAGAGVAFKLVSALAQEYFTPEDSKKYLTESIDIAAIGTVADCMELRGENRIIVAEGLKQIKKSRSKGIRYFIEDKMHEDLDGDIFGFLIGPRLNAAGRMDTPYKAVNLILNNGATLPDTIREIESLNELRKSKTSEFVKYALQDIDAKNNIIFYDSPDISHGIIGIVAGRLTEKYHKPAIVLIDEGDKLVASCRSPEYFSLIDILEKYNDMFLAYGGHKQAAGFSIAKETYNDFRNKITHEVNALDFSQYTKELHIDANISLDQIGFGLLEKISRFKPFGMGNPKPLFLIENYEIEGVKFLGKGRDHLRFDSRYGFKIFAFNFGEYYDDIKNLKSCSLICELAEDSWQGQRGIMIRVMDIIV